MASRKNTIGCSKSERGGSRALEVPSPFITKWIGRLAPTAAGSLVALDVATGRGRHAWLLAIAGFKTFAVDRNVDSLRDLKAQAWSQGLPLALWAVDLELTVLPVSHFDLVVCTRYLQRNLFPALHVAIKPGGIVLYETFTVLQRQHETGPRSPDHLLEPLELRAMFSGWTELEYEEVDQPDALARLAARKPPLPTVD